MEEDLPIQQVKRDKKTYMREYKRKVYNENSKSILEKNKAYYYKYKYGLDETLMKKYDTLLPYVAKIRAEIAMFSANNLDLSIECIETILDELKVIKRNDEILYIEK